jgi:hypothetical protein
MLLQKEKRRPPFITLVGEPGTGKTTMGCMFPSAVVLRLEDGVEAVPDRFKPELMEKIETTEQLDQQLRWLHGKRREHGIKTVIIDSATRLESMIEAEIVANDPNNPQSINQACGGFGAGVKAVGNRQAYFRKLLGVLNEKGDFTVIIIAHSTTELVEPPDGDNYTRHTLRLSKHSMAPWVDDVDMVGFIQLHRYVRGAKEGNDKGIGAKAGKAKSDGTRIIVFGPRAGNVSKNRFSLEHKVGDDYLELPDPNKPDTQNALMPLIPYFVENGYCGAQKEEKSVDEPELLQDDFPADENVPVEDLDDEPAI